MSALVRVNSPIYEQLIDKCEELGISEDELTNIYLSKCLNDDQDILNVNGISDLFDVQMADSLEDELDKLYKVTDEDIMDFCPKKDPLTIDEARELIVNDPDSHSNVRFSDIAGLVKLSNPHENLKVELDSYGK